MTYCVRCELDDSMYAHSPAAIKVAAREQQRPKPSRSGDRRNSSRDWEGERLLAADFLRAAKDEDQARSDFENAWDGSACWCDKCSERRWYGTADPAHAGLLIYSKVAMQAAVRSLLEERDHDKPLSLVEVLDLLRYRHNEARTRDADDVGLDQAVEDRGRSQKPAARWLGRSPGYYSRGH